MRRNYLLWIIYLFLSYIHLTLANIDLNASHTPYWLVNWPEAFRSDDAGAHGKLVDVRNDPVNITEFNKYIDSTIWTIDGWTDGENVDTLEHFFYGMKNGISMELGGLDGSPKTRSMTYDLERLFGWKRIIIDGNPMYREPMKKNSPDSFSAIAAICETHTTVHYATSEYVGGILEFMGKQFMKDYHKNIYESTNPPGELSLINWENFPKVFSVACMPLSHILHKAKVTHINFFILDVEGGELEILKSINWNHTVFDVLCIETEVANRPPNYAQTVTSYLADRGYVNATGQIGRNIWFRRKDFVPYKRPGIHPDCFNGYGHSDYADRWYLNRKTPKFQLCKMDYPS